MMNRPIADELASIKLMLSFGAGVAVIASMICAHAMLTRSPLFPHDAQPIIGTIEVLFAGTVLVAIVCGLASRLIGRQIERLPAER